MYLYQILLGVPTFFGDSDIAQTYIQFFGFLLGLITLMGLVITLNLQRIAIDEQTKVNDLQNKVAMTTLTPVISLKTQRKEQDRWKGTIYLNVSVASCIIYKYGFKKISNFFDPDVEELITNVPHDVGEHPLKYIGISPNVNKAEPLATIQGLEIDELKLVIEYGDKFGLTRYRSEFYMEEIYQYQPKFKLVQHEQIV